MWGNPICWMTELQELEALYLLLFLILIIDSVFFLFQQNHFLYLF